MDDNRGHLTLSRKPGEALLLDLDGEQVTIRVLEVAGQRVRLGIDAAHRVRIIREEIVLLPRKDVEALERFDVGGEG